MPTESTQRERFSQLLGRHQSQLLGYLLAMVMNHSDAEDLFQKSALVMWQKFDEFDESTNFMSWACRIAYYETSNFLRTKRPIVSDHVAAWIDAMAAEQRPRDEQHDQQVALAGCLEKLKTHDRALLDLVYAEDLSVGDAAARVNRSPSGVANTLLRIRRSLLDCVRLALRREDSV